MEIIFPFFLGVELKSDDWSKNPPRKTEKSPVFDPKIPLFFLLKSQGFHVKDLYKSSN